MVRLIISRMRALLAVGSGKYPRPDISPVVRWSYTFFSLFWCFRYLKYYGWVNFLWFCDFANFLVCAGLWFRSPRLMSCAAVGVFIPEIFWIVDLGSRLITGVHLVGGTAYMFNPQIPLDVRLLSLFHLPMLGILGLTLSRWGYVREGLLMMTLVGCGLLTLAFFASNPTRDINWVFGLYGKVQQKISPPIYYLLCLLVYPGVLFAPAHIILLRIFHARNGA